MGKVKVLIFGSIITNEFSPNSDIDVLIISKNLPDNIIERIKIVTLIKSKIGSFSPFQLHLATTDEYKNWYKMFIKKNFKLI